MEHAESKQQAIVNYFLISFIIVLIGMILYHPFFWGDELEPWRLIEKNTGSYYAAFLEYSQYKPRLLFNSTWELIPFLDASRAWAMTLMLSGEIAATLVIYYLAKTIISDRPIQIWLVVLAFISSRFGVIIWYDYLSGSIETLSFAFFISGIAILVKHKENISILRMAIGFFLFLLCVFVHERYIPAILIISIYLAVFNRAFTKHRLLLLFLGTAPAIAFYICNMLLGKHSIAMGTAGRTISISPETFFVFITYISNVFFQTNFGLAWFVGNFNWTSVDGKTISIAGACIFSVIYLFSLFGKKGVENKHLLSICILSILALIFIASLPGLDRQESRWMYPVYGLMLIVSIIYFSNLFSTIFLLVLISFNCIYIFSGSTNAIANIAGSNTAHKLGTSISTITPSKSTGIIIGEGSTNWIINAGSPNGATFSRANNLDHVRLDSTKGDTLNIDSHYGFALIRTGKDADHVPIFKIMSATAAKYLATPNNISEADIAAEQVIGNKELWKNWRLAENMHFEEGLLLAPSITGFTEVSAEDLNGNILVYSANTLGKETVPMRIQVNWIDEKQQFISATIKVVNVHQNEEKHTALILAPDNAKKGLVYISLHLNNNEEKVKISKVSIAKTSN